MIIPHMFKSVMKNATLIAHGLKPCAEWRSAKSPPTRRRSLRVRNGGHSAKGHRAQGFNPCATRGELLLQPVTSGYLAALLRNQNPLSDRCQQQKSKADPYGMTG